MIRPIVIFFVLFSATFAVVHILAMLGSLYWYYWWFDIVMHFWGGLLLGIGAHAFCTFKLITLKPTLSLVLLTLLAATTTWELFEWFAGLYDPATYLFDTSKDMLIGFSGGLLAHFIIKKYTIG